MPYATRKLPFRSRSRWHALSGRLDIGSSRFRLSDGRGDLWRVAVAKPTKEIVGVPIVLALRAAHRSVPYFHETITEDVTK
jgi:hypothetical protein